MNLLPNTEQQQFLESVSKFASTSLSVKTNRKLAEAGKGLCGETWKQAAELGLFSSTSFPFQVLACNELGKQLAPLPYFFTVLVSGLLDEHRDSDLANKITSGDFIVTFARKEESGIHTLFDASSAHGVALLDGNQLKIYPTSAFDSSEEPASFDPLSEVTRAELATGSSPLIEIEEPSISSRIAVLLASHATGIAEASRDASAEYAKVRVQFGKPIGMFQAVKHKCADMAVRAESAISLTRLAGAMVAEENPGAEFHALAANSLATRYALENCRDNIQNFGAYGTLEDQNHQLYMKRCHVLDILLGSYRQNLDALAEQPSAF